MPEEAVAPPPAPPSPPSSAPPADNSDLPPPQVIKAISPEDDPNHQMALLLAKRRDKKAKEGEKGAKTPDPEVPEEGGKTPEKPPPLGDLIANALKMRGKKPAPGEKPKEKEEKTPPPAPPPDEEPAKTVISKAKPKESVGPDTARIASEAATAAARAAMAEIRPSLQAKGDQVDHTATLKASDRREYAIAEYLAKSNTRYKDAPKIILDHVKKAEAYVARWEAANPDKEFSSKDPEHDDFYDSLEKPWSDEEFRDAEIKMVAEPLAEEKTTAAQAKIRELESANARLELVPIIDRTFTQAATILAKGLGEDTFQKVSKDFDLFMAEDPITADALAKTLGEIRPLVETAIQIDDSKGRIPFDMNNPMHQAWNEIVHEGERRYAGVKDDQGRTFARRADYGQMNAAQRARSWFLTKEHIISGIVDETTKLLVDYVKNEKERQKKIAESLGYIPKTAELPGKEKPSGAKSKSDDILREEPPVPVKPTSPTVGSGAKIDNSSSNKPTGRAATVAAMHEILFRR